MTLDSIFSSHGLMSVKAIVPESKIHEFNKYGH